MWQCALYGITGETATPGEASAALREHVRAAHHAGALIGPTGSQGEDRVSRVEAKHGLPLEDIQGHVFVLHYEVPQQCASLSTSSQDARRAGPEASGTCPKCDERSAADLAL
jgi:hypothetical protein